LRRVGAFWRWIRRFWVARSKRENLPIFQLPKLRRLIGNFASKVFSSMKPVWPDGPAVENSVSSLFMRALSF
jgi:hypothetical protein